jgi:hypothetical protein
MININTYYKFLLFLMNKSGKSNPTPDQINTVAPRAYFEWFNKRYNNTADYRQEAPVTRVGYDASTRVMDDLKDFKEFRPFNVDSEGKVLIPNGTTVRDANNQIAPEYLHLSSLKYNFVYNNKAGKITSRNIEVIQMRNSEVGKILGSDLTYPVKENPKAEVFSDHIQFYPKDLSRVTVTYLRMPVTPVWGYTTVNKRPVYDASTSVDFEISEDNLNELVFNSLSYFGINMREQQISQEAEIFKQQGS